MPRLAAETSTRWAGSAAQADERRVPWPTPASPDPAPRLPWAAALPAGLGQTAPWPTPQAADPVARAPWGPSQRSDMAPWRAPWIVSQRADTEGRLDAPALLQRLALWWAIPWGVSAHADLARGVAGVGLQAFRPLAVALSAPWTLSPNADTLAWLPWGMGRRIEAGVLVIVPPPDPGDLGGAFIPLQAVYLVANSVTLTRADNGQPVPARNLSVGISRDGPHWTWSASIPGSARALIAPNPDPVELIATLNGTAVHVLVESLRRDRRFGEDAIRASGRSRSAWLSAPYAPVVTRSNGSAAMAQQLAADALTVNGVPIGWALDWQVNDWLVPAGTWSHQGTAMEAVARVAEAAGGYLQVHPSALTLRALAHYPVAPWAWGGASPDVLIPEDVAEQEGAEVLRKADYNAVYVIGQGAGGRRDRILRAGSAGDKVAPQILDPLATDPAMTAPRGLVALADTGLQTLITLRLPVLPDTGLILPGKLVQYSAEGTSRRGLTRSLQADWTLPELWQTIEIETHG